MIAGSSSLIRKTHLLAPAFCLLSACRNSTEPTSPSTWMTLAASEHYTCGLTAAGEAFCWGGVPAFYDPQPLVDSVIPNSAVPLRVPGGRRFVDIAVGALSMCALDADDQAFCWGANQMGEVGDSSYLAKRGPSAVVGGLRWRMVSSSGVHVCGITVDGNTYCWGNQFRGALGNGTLNGSSPRPVAVLGALTFTKVYGGMGTSCALTADAEAYCWGINDYGILGDSQPPVGGKESASPSRVVGGHRFASLALGGNHACGVTEDAGAYCWGWNAHGQLGNGSTEPSSSPVLVSGGLHWASLSLGNQHSCGLTTDGSAYCWGNNERGQFGTGVTGKSSSPELIAAPGTYVMMKAGGNHTCGITPTRTAFCWGQGDYGQLGDGVIGDRLRPTRVAGYK